MNNISHQLLAQVPTELGPIGGDSCAGLGPLCKIASGVDAISALATVISTIIGFITVVAGLYFMFQLLIGGFEWMTASGDKTRLQKAQDRLTNAVMGLIIVVAAYGLVSIIGRVLGLENILLNAPGDLIDQLRLGGGTP